MGHRAPTINHLLIFKNEFAYNSPYWTNKETYAVQDGLKGLNKEQTKLASYWNTPFDKICLGMKANDVIKWIVINRQASSLFSVIAGGVYESTSAGREKWLSLMDGSRLQENCNGEGFNIDTLGAESAGLKVRIGLIANNENECLTCDSLIGFGTSARCWGESRETSCGNVAICDQLQNMNIAAFGYMFVQ